MINSKLHKVILFNRTFPRLLYPLYKNKQKQSDKIPHSLRLRLDEYDKKALIGKFSFDIVHCVYTSDANPTTCVG